MLIIGHRGFWLKLLPLDAHSLVRFIYRVDDDDEATSLG